VDADTTQPRVHEERIPRLSNGSCRRPVASLALRGPLPSPLCFFRSPAPERRRRGCKRVPLVRDFQESNPPRGIDFFDQGGKRVARS
jgi:hypothetical protein